MCKHLEEGSESNLGDFSTYLSFYIIFFLYSKLSFLLYNQKPWTATITFNLDLVI